MATIGTHGGEFHMDDALAAAVLRREFPGCSIVRTREQSVLATADVVFDVGMVYEPARGRFDHHQQGGAGARENGIPFAAAGLVWRHYGRQMLAATAARYGVDVEALWARVDNLLVCGIDAADNGVLESSAALKGHLDIKIAVTSLSGVISLLNPVVGIQDAAPEAYDKAFERAVALAGEVLDQVIARAVVAVKAAAIVAAADRGEPVLVFDQACPDVGCPWTDSVCAREHIEFVIFPTPAGPNRSTEWRIKSAPVRPGSFEVRRQLPAAWGGKDGAALSTLTGVSGCVFCHKGLWIAGAKTRDAALELARLALA